MEQHQCREDVLLDIKELKTTMWGHSGMNGVVGDLGHMKRNLEKLDTTVNRTLWAGAGILFLAQFLLTLFGPQLQKLFGA